MNTRKMELMVGAFMLAGLAALAILVVRVANVDLSPSNDSYQVSAVFDNIGGLKAGSPVKVGGVVVGRVAKIELDPELLSPRVTLLMDGRYREFSDNSTVSILTSGLLGEQYIGLTPGFFLEDETELLAEGSVIHDTRSAIVLEDLIGQFLYSLKSDN
ncbi:outer membrane lipid asymmetry maintenance protein MlaD [Paraferrimonas sedimenticola]|uniref:Outer membrane lipid asymmetry maintenance protein MlaD n=1 Tax=Paraferrimonas sedimenticola TaxID=375674 RepID=A0AA37RW44_9GAMM|nr:outer membrane lipid asymmetry maintenance protein MlaD [Paraferrimonas sedimenticola]GLP95822.1 outer membrane lipid asymmetry maintenance protein MlaD [Paraferrimonas sedimenticola]